MIRFLKTNSGKNGEGMPVVRNPQFYFRKGNRMPVVFKVLDQKGSFSSPLIWRKMLAAPITDIDREIPSDLRERLLEVDRGIGHITT